MIHNLEAMLSMSKKLEYDKGIIKIHHYSTGHLTSDLQPCSHQGS